MKQVLYLGGFELPDKNAAAQRVLSNAKLLRELGFDVKFVGISKDIKTAPSVVDGFESSPVPYPNSTRQWLRHVFTFICKDDILRREPDYIVLYNFPAVASLKIIKTAHKHGIKVIQDITEWESNNGWKPSDFVRKTDIALRMRYCIKKMDGAIVISRYLYDYYKDYVKTILVPPTVDLKTAKWDRTRKLSANNPVLLIYAGSPGSGVKDRLDVIIEGVGKRTDILLNIIGLTEEQYFETFHKQPVHYNNILFKGRLSHEEAILEVCNADFQMLIREPSLKNTAGFPTKLVESMACGTPVIATVFSNILDYLHDGENGFVIKNGQSLNDILNKIVGMDAVDIIRMKKNCIDMKVFDYHYYKSEFEKLFV